MFKFGIPNRKRSIKSEEVRENLDSLGINNATARSDEPANPRNGMARILSENPDNVVFQIFWNAWRTIFSNIEGSVTQARRKEESFTSSTTWQYDHNLGAEPVVNCIDTTKKVILPLEIEHASVNRVIVTHSIPTAGRIIVVG